VKGPFCCCISSALVLSLLFSIGCGGGPVSDPTQSQPRSSGERSAAPTVTLTASPSSIDSGDTATLSWTSQNADSIKIDGVPGDAGNNLPANGELKVTPSTTMTYTATATGNGTTATASVKIEVRGPTVSLSLNSSTIFRGQSATLSWSCTGVKNATIDPDIGVQSCPGSTQVSPRFDTIYTATIAGTIGPAKTSVSLVVQYAANYSYKYDNTRVGTNSNEFFLKPANVTTSSFGKLASAQVDGAIFAQPLYVPKVNIPGKGMRNLLIVCTERDSVYAFDADDLNTLLWKTSFIDSANSVTTVPTSVANDPGGRTALGIEVGITGTPVVDPKLLTLYVSAMTWEQNTTAVHRLHALEVTTGTERTGSPVVEAATVAGTGAGSTGGQLTFNPLTQNQRAGLVLQNGVVYVAWGSFSDHPIYHGWIMGYDATTLKQVAVMAIDPDDVDGGIWQAGGAPAVDGRGNIYVLIGNGTFNADSGGTGYGESALKLRQENDNLKIVDYFTPYNQACLEQYNLDLGSSAAVVLPDGSGTPEHPNLLVSGSKEGRLYLLDRDKMGHYSAGQDIQIPSWLLLSPNCDDGTDNASNETTPRIYSQPAYYKGRIYVATSNGDLKVFALFNATFTKIDESNNQFGPRSPIPVVSSNGDQNGIVWLIERNDNTGFGTLRAYDAEHVSNEIWNSNKVASDALPNFTDFFMVPVVANGNVYVPTRNAITVFGLKVESALTK
jgi:hypothetical protein